MMSRPAAFSSVASAVIAMVGEGLTRARRSARNGITGLWFYKDKRRKLYAKPAGVKPVPAIALIEPDRSGPLRLAASFEGGDINKFSCTRSLRRGNPLRDVNC